MNKGNNRLNTYSYLYTYHSKSFGYVFFKTLLLIIFTIPYFALQLVSVVVSFTIGLLRYIPVIGILFEIICKIIDFPGVLIWLIMSLPDTILNKDAIANSNSMDYYDTMERLRVAEEESRYDDYVD